MNNNKQVDKISLEVTNVSTQMKRDSTYYLATNHIPEMAIGLLNVAKIAR